jgi:hypothetical protein
MYIKTLFQKEKTVESLKPDDVKELFIKPLHTLLPFQRNYLKTFLFHLFISTRFDLRHFVTEIFK